MSRRWAPCALALAGGFSSALARAQAATAAPSAVTSQFLSVILGMAMVLAVIAGAAWLLKRLAPRTYGSASVLRVVAATAVGQRERVVVVEVGSTWLIVGVAPGSVNALHQMPRAADVETALPRTDASKPFAHWLKQIIEKRNER